MSNLRIAELDFDQIKQNLKEFLKAQDEFTDYDFEGSGLSVLLDILAYNTHYNAYLANMLMNEMFLDSAVKRSSVVSLAKHLGYTPRSVRGSTAVLDISVNNPTGSPVTLTLDRYTPFSTITPVGTFQFYTLEPAVASPVGTTYTFNDITVKQGTLLGYNFNVVTPGPDEKYEIPNLDTDTTTILVTVQKSASDLTTETYTLSTGIIDIDETSKVYFIEENTRGYYQLFFGDGVLGKKLETGNIIRIQYLIAAGSDSNTSSSYEQSFTSENTIGGSSNITINTVSNATGGAIKETIASIRYNAPRSINTQNRVITQTDYETLITSNYADVESVAVWGGEENDPPEYGRVFISLKPYTGFTVNAALVEEIKNTLLRPRQVVTVKPIFVDPDYLHVGLSVSVQFNKNLTTISSSYIEQQVRSAITNYFSNNLQQFEKDFYYSKLTNTITAVNESIVSVLAEITIQKRLEPVLNVVNTFTGVDKLKFSNKLHPGEIASTRFFTTKNNQLYHVRITDTPDVMPPSYDGTGTLKMYTVDDSNEFIGDVGTVNYATGDINLTSILVTGYSEDQFDLRINAAVQENSYNILASKNQVIVLDNSTGNVVSDRVQGLTISVAAI